MTDDATDDGSLELYFLRHAHAGDPEAWQGADEERPLSDRGRKQSKRLGRWLNALGFTPDLVLTSPKARARQTAELVAKPLRRDVLVNARLAGDFGLDSLERVLDESTDGQRRVVLVGHDPDMSSLLALLCGASRVPMRKGAMARIDVERPLTPGGGTLRWLVGPDLIKPS